ncbi:MAG: hypothetical protein J7K30_10530 [Deltaproteobacteria bacterium]|nr:hypothetical protein [Deltaproteobacteria bacterium]
MLKIMQRMCWNTRGWKLPSGSTYEGGFPGEQGYGHEEWNFQLADKFQENIFPYTYQIPQEKKLEENDGKFSIGFFSRHPETKEWLMVGIHHDAEIISDEEYSEIIKFFDGNGVFKRRANELFAASETFKNYKAALKEVYNGFKKKWIRVKCNVENVEYFTNPILIPKPSSHRFTRFSYVEKFPVSLESQIIDEQKPSALAEDGYYRESSFSLKTIIPKHNILSNKFCNWLKSQKIDPIQEENYVDVIFEFNGNKFIAELKIVYGSSTTKAIRESIGQLLEYNHYPSRTAKDKWLIVLDEKPSESDLIYIDNIRNKYNFPLCLGWENNGEFELYPFKIRDL